MRESSLINTTTRRDFLIRREAALEGHIASVLVHARPGQVDRLAARLDRLPGVESHDSNGAGKLIVTIEVADDAQLIERMTRIQTEDGVIAASLVYHHVGDVDDEG